MGEQERPAAERREGETPRETTKQRERWFVGREVGPEDEERKSPGGPGSQVAPEVEPSGS
jgi:hypothetical protein